MKYKNLILTVLLVTVPIFGFCQFDSIVNKMHKEFNAFKKGIELEHQQFRLRNDSIFSAFLKESWESFNVFFKPKPEEKPKPSVQPVIPNIQDTIKQPGETFPADSSETGIYNKPTGTENKPERKDFSPDIESTGKTPLNVDFYGSAMPLFVSGSPPGLMVINGNGISNYFDVVSNSGLMQELTKQLASIKKEKKLNDWGFLQLVRKTSSRITASKNEAELLSWIILLKCGINAKVGYSKDQVFLMVPCLDEIYASWYLNINENQYYIITEGTTREKISSLMVHKADYPGNLPISLSIEELPAFNQNIIDREFSFKNIKFIVHINLNLIDFFQNYPQTSLNIFFSTPLSEQITNSLDTLLKPMMSGFSDLQIVSLLLEFTQKTFAYKTDREQFGHEKFFFPDELFYYPYSDCEDRSILFTRLVEHFTRLSCIALNFPKHVNTAVAVSDDAQGDFIKYKNHRFLICDPTYINAPVGYLPKEFNSIRPEVINFE